MKSYNLDGLANINIELTSRCNKNCWMCGRRKVEREYPDLALKYGDMELALVKRIAKQLPPNVVVQLHNNGEGTLYPHFGKAVKLFSRQITNIVTNGKLLLEKANEIIDNLDTLAISVIENDPEADEQYRIVEEFLRLKGAQRPSVIFRLNGNVDPSRYERFGLPIARRILHSALGSFNYQKTDPTVPEIGICLDFLNHIAINSQGKVSICVRFDPKGLGVIGDAKKQSLASIWNGKKRQKWLKAHVHGKRENIPLCAYCHFWGVPTGYVSTNLKNKINENAILSKELSRAPD